MEAADRAHSPSRPGDGAAGPSAPAFSVLAGRVRPVSLASERALGVPDPLAGLFPERRVRRGSTIALNGAPGSGLTTVTAILVGAVTSEGEWAAWVGGASVCAPALADAGVALERLVVVRDVPNDRLATVTAALLEGMSMVVVGPGHRLRARDGRRLSARARERGSLLVVTGDLERASVRIEVSGGPWEWEAGRLKGRDLEVAAVRHGRVLRHRVA